jgi:hypothetical protein
MHKKEKYCFIKKRFKTSLQLFFLFLSIHAVSSAQVIDTVKTAGVHDTVILKKTVVLHSPKKASLYSTICPGLGQAYNKKYWKIPVLYAGFAGLGYSIYSNQKDYIRYRTAYRIRMDTDSTTTDEFVKTIRNPDNLLKATKTLHRWRDLSIFGAALLYVLNIVDATVDAHLFSFDVSDDLSLNFQPAFFSTASITNKQPVNVTGLSIHLNF